MDFICIAEYVLTNVYNYVVHAIKILNISITSKVTLCTFLCCPPSPPVQETTDLLSVTISFTCSRISCKWNRTVSKLFYSTVFWRFIHLIVCINIPFFCCCSFYSISLYKQTTISLSIHILNLGCFQSGVINKATIGIFSYKSLYIHILYSLLDKHVGMELLGYVVSI